MNIIFNFLANHFNVFLLSMVLIAVIVFVALYFVDAGYGLFFNKKWGHSINNKVAWVIMESPVFFAMIALFAFSDRVSLSGITCFVIFLLFEIHYFQRSFIFPAKMRGNSKMPLSIVFMGVTFNLLNAIMQGGWLFYISPVDMYSVEWMKTPQFIIGTIIFFVGMCINLNSDHIVRNLRAPGDTKHYLPKGGLYNQVTSANYFGELVEWTGFAILTWSLSGAVFVIWTFANLAPRAAKINKRYKEEFASEMEGKNLKRIIPYIY